MNEIKFPINQSQQDYVNAKLTSIYSAALGSPGSENLIHTNNSTEGNKNNKNNPNISRTTLDTQLIDLNADGDSDESNYNNEL